MTLENALLTAIGSVTGALCILAKILWKRSEDCENDRRFLREEIEEVKSSSGMNAGLLKAYEKCPAKPCPFKEPQQ